MKRDLILASASPRRKQLLGLLGLKFKVVNSNYREVVKKDLSHKDLVKFLALGKAKAVSKKYPKAIIISADTMVSFNGKILGKPKNKKDAVKMLKSFSGKSQLVITGMVALDAETKQVVIEEGEIKIYFKNLSDEEILQYVESGEPFDKAGGYNLQGRGFNLIEKIEGDFTDGLGMSMTKLFNALQKLGLKV